MHNIIGFFGGDTQTGTTMVAQSTAEILARKNKNVMLILGSGNHGCDFVKNKDNKSLDSIKVQITNENLEPFDLDQILLQNENVTIVPGIGNTFLAGYFPETSMETIIGACRKVYDYIIIDGGSNWNLGLTISALKIADKKYFVTTQQEKSLRRFIQVKEKVLEPLKITGCLVINKYIKNVALYTSKELEGQLMFDESIKVPYVETSWQAEIRQKTLLTSHKFEKGINEIAANILGEVVEKKWIRNFLWKPT